MHFLEAIVLGIVQGLTEFLPISSTAHLVLVPYFFKWPDPGLTFDVALHLGTFLAVAWYFWSDLWKLFRGFFQSFRQKDWSSADQRLPWLILLGTIPAGVAGILFEKRIETTLRSPLLIAWMLILVGLVLWGADRWSRTERKMDSVRWPDALLVGLAQALALIPGISRSGATITTGLFTGLNREAAARFSFLLGFPIILLSALFKLKDLSGALLATEWPFFLTGIVVSTVTGYLCIRFFLQYLQKHGFGVFVVYRILLGILVLWLFFSGRITQVTL